MFAEKDVGLAAATLAALTKGEQPSTLNPKP
jgi:hypothetical protein